MKRLTFLTLGILATASCVAVSPIRNLSDKGTVKDGVSLLEKDRVGKTKAPDPLDGLKDDQVFVKVGSDELKWKAVREQAELKISKGIEFPKGASAEDIDNMRRYSLKRSVSALMRRYLRNALVADKAQEIGLTVSEAEYTTAISNLVKSFEMQGSFGKRQAELARKGDSLIAHNVRNVLLADKYRREKVNPTVTVSREEIDDLIRKRHAENVSVAATNALLEVQIKDILKKIRRGKMDFATAASEYSECGSSTEGGVLGEIPFGEWMRPEWEAAFRKMKPGEISDVVETPFSYHILKLIDFTYDEEVATGAKMAHILLEKVQLRPELTREQAEGMIRNMKTSRKIDALWQELIEQPGKVTCAIPLLSKGKPKPSTKEQKPPKGKEAGK